MASEMVQQMSGGVYGTDRETEEENKKEINVREILSPILTIRGLLFQMGSYIRSLET